MDFMAAVNEKTEEPIVPQIIDPMDPAPLVNGFKQFEAKIAEMFNEADDHEVTDDASNSQAVEMIGQAKKLSSAIEAKRKEVTDPYLRVKQTVDGHVKIVRDRLSGIVITLERKIGPYLQKKENERREAERKAEEERRRLQEEADRKAREEAARLAAEAKARAAAEGADKKTQEEAAKQAALQAEPAPVVVVETVPDETKTKTSSATAGLKKEWTWELEDIRSLPDDIIEQRWNEIVKAVAPAINPRVKAGVRNIPGVKIFQQAKINTRVRR